MLLWEDKIIDYTRRKMQSKISSIISDELKTAGGIIINIKMTKLY